MENPHKSLSFFSSTLFQPEQVVRAISFARKPRRISAIGLAERVASERLEICGDVVGYSVRLESKLSKRTRLHFCTMGVLLRKLLSDPLLRDVTHVVLDEVHERSVESDLLLLLLRRLLLKRSDIRLVLMSATADAGFFADYFSKPNTKAVYLEFYQLNPLKCSYRLLICNTLTTPCMQFYFPISTTHFYRS